MILIQLYSHIRNVLMMFTIHIVCYLTYYVVRNCDVSQLLLFVLVYLMTDPMGRITF